MLLPAVEWIEVWLVSVHFKLHSGGVFFDLKTWRWWWLIKRKTVVKIQQLLAPQKRTHIGKNTP